ncbi:MAG: hypothetical protein AAGA80_21435 [Cyanobacteria bacterium P01_F01_bin.143]
MKMYRTSQFLDLIVNSIRGLEQMVETLDFSFNPVDALRGKSLMDFLPNLLLNIMNNLGVKNYPAKIRCRMPTSSRFQRTVLPIS